MKAIQTEYNGLKFRSRLEARWAYLFDLLDIKYEYEKEGYELPSGRYLPDFWLPQLKCWVEIKGETPNKTEEALAYDLADGSGYIVYMCWGEMPTGENVGSDSAYAYMPTEGWDNCYKLCVCLNCGAIGFEFDGRSDRLPCKQDKCIRSSHGDKGYTYDHPRLEDAYRKARQARFEHGETPSRPYANIVDYDDIDF